MEQEFKYQLLCRGNRTKRTLRIAQKITVIMVLDLSSNILTCFSSVSAVISTPVEHLNISQLWIVGRVGWYRHSTARHPAQHIWHGINALLISVSQIFNSI